MMNARTLSIAAATMLFAALVALYVVRIPLIPIHIDEAYNLEVPLLFSKLGLYGTATDNFQSITLFNPRITTGPAVLLPVAFLWSTAGVNVLLARVVPLLSLLALLAIVFAVVLRRSGELRTALFASSAVFATPFLQDFAVPVLGEVTAVALIVGGAAVIVSAPFWAGILVSLALLSKLQIGIFLPALLLELCLAKASRDSWLRFCFGAVIPLALFYGAIAIVGGLEGVSAHVGFFSKYREHALINGPLALGEHVQKLWQWAPWLLIFWGLALVFAPLLGQLKLVKSDAHSFRVFIVMGILWVLWWLCFNQSGWGRHLFPGLLVLVPFVTASLLHSSRNKLFAVCGAVPFVIGVFGFLNQSVWSTDYANTFPGELPQGQALGSYAEWQRADSEASRLLAALPGSVRVCSAGKYRDVKLEILVGKNLCILKADDLQRSEPLVALVGRFETMYDPDSTEAVRRHAVMTESVAGYLFVALNEGGAQELRLLAKKF